MFFEKDEKDDFWNVEKLIPKKKNILAPFSTKEKLTEINIEGETSLENTETKLTVTPPSVNEEGSRTYKLSGGLLRSVTIKRFVDKYDFYGNFRKAALVYYDFKTPKCEFVSFYSYMPQYSQFNSAQKNFYFYWRDCVRRKKFIKTDYSYFYLYIYEILNLPEKIPPEEGLRLLVSLWRAYRNELPNIDSNMSLWVQDYCLVYGLSCPIEDIRDFVFDVIGAAEFKEFYLANAENIGNDGINAMLACLSDYDWRRGKYAGGDNKDFYTEHMLGAMGLLVRELWRMGEITAPDAETVTVARSAFRNSLCTHSVKCRLEIEYVPLSKAQNLRAAITAAIRYTENKLRSLLGVKSRLAVKELTDGCKEIIDTYFDKIMKKAEAERKKAEMPEYEKLYDAANEGFSFDGADEIERLSWSTTARLIEDEADYNEEIYGISDIQEKSEHCVFEEEVSVQESSDVDKYGLSVDEIKFVNAVKNADKNEIKRISEMLGLLADALADKINEAFADGFGDIIIENTDGECTIIEDYTEDIDVWLSKAMK